MSPDTARGWETRGRFPRVSGDEPVQGNAHHLDVKFSPRERG